MSYIVFCGLLMWIPVRSEGWTTFPGSLSPFRMNDDSLTAEKMWPWRLTESQPQATGKRIYTNHFCKLLFKYWFRVIGWPSLSLRRRESVIDSAHWYFSMKSSIRLERTISRLWSPQAMLCALHVKTWTIHITSQIYFSDREGRLADCFFSILASIEELKVLSPSPNPRDAS